MMFSNTTLLLFFQRDQTTKGKRMLQGEEDLCSTLLKQLVFSQLYKFSSKRTDERRGGTSNLLQKSWARSQSLSRQRMVSHRHLHKWQILSQLMPLEASTSLKEVLLWRHNHRQLTTFGNTSGLSLAIQLDCQQLDVKLDAKVIVDLINKKIGLYYCRLVTATLVSGHLVCLIYYLLLTKIIIIIII